MMRFFWFLFLAIALIACKSDREEEVQFLEGNYRLVKVTSDIAVDYNADGQFEKEILQYLECHPALTFVKNGTMQFPSINIYYTNITWELQTGYILQYTKPTCETSTADAKYSISGSSLNITTDSGMRLVCENSNGVIKHTKKLQLVVDAGNGNKILKDVILEFQFSKN